MKGRISVGTVFLLLLGAIVPLRAHARTFLVPHVLEKEGTVSNTTYTFDTTLWMTYSPGMVDNEPVSSATVDLYLLNNDGSPMLSTTAVPVCNPCSFNLDGTTRRQTASLENLITSAGAGGWNVKTGFALLEVSGDDTHVAISMGVANAHSSAFDLDMYFPEVRELPGGLDPSLRLIVFPYIFESQGTTGSSPYSFDTWIYAAYAGGVAGSSIPAGSGAYVYLYLFDSNGTAMQGLSGTVCAPCVESISSLTPEATFNLDALISSAGGPNFGSKIGFALMAISGTADAVTVDGVMVNAHTGPFDLATADLKWQEVPTSGRPTAAETPALGALLRSYPNPMSAASTRIDYTMPHAGSATLEIVDVQGRIVARPASGHQPAGPHTIDWNGRDDDGRPLPSGVYFARLVTDAGVRTLKMTIVR